MKMRIGAEQVRDDIVVIRPVYSPTGDVTELITVHGKALTDHRHIKSVIKALARSYALDLQAQKRITQVRLHRRAILPFYLGNRVFVPLKMRQVVAPHDSTYGYVDVSYIGEIEVVAPKCCRLLLVNGVELIIPSRLSTVVQGQYLGNILRGELSLQHEDSEEQ